MRVTFISSAVIAVMCVMSGCGMQGGTTVVKQESGTAPRTTEVTKAGSYALYDSYDTTPQITVPLERGDEIGFRKSNDGQTVAVAGSREIPLTNTSRTYYWKMK